MTLTASRFLDPRADVVFKKVFGEHANLPAGFLNAVMPLTSPIVGITFFHRSKRLISPSLSGPLWMCNVKMRTGAPLLLKCKWNGVPLLPKEFKESPEIVKACELVQESAYNKAELRAYNEYRDAVQIEATLLEDRFERGEAKGREEGRAEGELRKAQEVAKALISKKMDDAFIVETTGLSLAEVQLLRSGR